MLRGKHNAIHNFREAQNLMKHIPLTTHSFLNAPDRNSRDSRQRGIQITRCGAAMMRSSFRSRPMTSVPALATGAGGYWHRRVGVVDLRVARVVGVWGEALQQKEL